MIKNWFSRNYFLTGILSAVIAGSIFSKAITPLNPDGTTVLVLVVVLFFVQGFKLPAENIITGLTNYRLHIFIQIFIFIIYPIYFFFLLKIVSPFLDSRIVIGFYALSALPTSVSSSTVFTCSAGGNVSGTMFNVVLSNIAGVFISPLLISLLLSTSGQGLPVDEVFRILVDLFIKMVLPIIAGQAARQFVKKFAEKNKKKLNTLSNIIILAMLLFAIAGSGKMFSFEKLKMLIFPFILLIVTYPLILIIISMSGKMFGFNREDRISSIFTASQKTLAMGLPLLTTYFASIPELIGYAIMPILFYQAYQLIVCALVFNRIKMISAE